MNHFGSDGEKLIFVNAADADDITLPDGGYTSFQPDPIQLESRVTARFDDAEGNDETQADFTCEERGIPEPEQCEKLSNQNCLHNSKGDDRAEEEDEMNTEVIQKCAKRAKKEKAAAAATAMDDDETIIPGDVYQSWLEDPSDLRSNGGKNRKRRSKNRFSAKNMKFLMEVPQTALVQNLVDVKNGTVCYYPAPLSELWRRDSYAAAAASPPPSSAYSPERQTSPEDAFPMPVVHPTGGGGGGGGGIPDVVEPRIHTPDLFMQDSDASGRLVK
ncbi:hypothetical protein M569_17514 [Genlisea aurea]|uniref:Uncharacterized protein n=1 Tax=Genlisea aurea TaxID=192259 RepID=S8BRQ9_9LAMI|nr:hypothetical protein M569_17514 [Genlisea aurea]